MNYEAVALWSQVLSAILFIAVLVWMWVKFMQPAVLLAQQNANAAIAEAERHRDEAKAELASLRGEVENAQRDAIAFLADAYGLRTLSPALREAAQLRLAHPDETLAELGRRCSPPVGKATINGRLAAVLRLVKRLRGEREEPEVSSV